MSRADLTCIGGPNHGELLEGDPRLGVVRLERSKGPGKKPEYYILQRIQPGNLPIGHTVHVWAHEMATLDDFRALNCAPIADHRPLG